MVPDDDYIDDVYVRDHQEGTVERISVSSTGEPGTENSGYPTISGNGNVIAFITTAYNIAGQTGGQFQVVMVNRLTNAREMISVGMNGSPGSGDSTMVFLSRDGNLAAFSSSALNLVMSDTNFYTDIFLRDITLEETKLISHGMGGSANNSSSDPYISADGNFVQFTSYATNLVSTDTNSFTDVFLYDVANDTVELISTDSQGTIGNDYSYGCGVSADGRYSAFASRASNLVLNDMNEETDIFIKDRLTGLVERVSVAQDGKEANGSSSSCGISADGNSVAFLSAASNLIPNDIGPYTDVFIWDRIPEGDLTPTPTATTTIVTTLTSTPIPSNTATSSPTSTPTFTATPTYTTTPINTVTPTPTATPTTTATHTPTTTFTPTTMQQFLYLPLVQR
jgi:hypothetical protein